MPSSAVHKLSHRNTSGTGTELVHDALPTRVHFGAGRSTDHLAHELIRLGTREVGLVSSPAHSHTIDEIIDGLADRRIHATETVPDAPSPAGYAVAAIGGNAIIGRAKKVAHHIEAPLIVLPTTYSGAELDARLLTAPSGHLARRSLATAVIYDPRLTRTLPVREAGLSLLAAVGNALEALTETPAGSLAQLIATQGLRQLSRSALDVIYDVQGLQGPASAQLGAYLAGAAAAICSTTTLIDATVAACEDGTPFQIARAALVRRSAKSFAHQQPDAYRFLAQDLQVDVLVEHIVRASGLGPELAQAQCSQKHSPHVAALGCRKPIAR